MSQPSGGPTAPDDLFPDLPGASAPAPPAESFGWRVGRMLARAALWSLVAVGALRGLAPHPPPPPAPPAAGPGEDRRAAAVAEAFTREYLTVADGQRSRAARLRQLTVEGLDLGRSLSIPAGTAQYADQVAASGASRVDGGVEVTVVAHVLQLRSGTYRDGGLLAFSVPLVVRPEGVAVNGPPRPTGLPVAAELPPDHPAQRSTVTPSPAARRVARQAVITLLAEDAAGLVRLGGGRPPSTRPLPAGWSATRVGDAEAASERGGLTVEVPVQARPPDGQARYTFPVRVQLAAGHQGPVVRRVDAGGTP